MNDITALSPVTPEMLASLKLSAMNLAEGEMMSFEPVVFRALVEALEKAQERIGELESHKESLLKFIRESCYVFDGYDADISDAYTDAASSSLMPKIEAEPCRYCSDGSYSGLPGGACEHCMGTGLDNPAAELESRTVTVKLSLPRRKTAADYVDDTFEACDLAAVYNACRLECEVKFKNALTAAGIQVIEGEQKNG